MNYRPLIICCVAYILFFSSIANAADSFCSDLKNVVSYARSEFQQLKGQPRGKSGKSYSATISLPGASECYVRTVKRGVYWCSWEVDRSSMRSEFSTFASAAGACYGMKPEIDNDGKELSTFIELSSGETIYITENREDAVIDMSIEKDH